MYDLNITTISGRLVRKPELKYSATGTAICEFTVACNWGKGEKEVNFYNCAAFGKRAENIAEYLTKGSPVNIVGEHREHRWMNESGIYKNKWTLNVREFQMLSSGQKKEEQPPLQEIGLEEQEDNQEKIPY